jgi:hypothetical protein
LCKYLVRFLDNGRICFFAFEIYLPLAFVINLNHLPSASLPQVSAQNMAGVQSNIKNVNDKSIFAGAI